MTRPLPAWWWLWAAGQGLFWLGGAELVRRWHRSPAGADPPDPAGAALTFLRPLKSRGGAPRLEDLAAFLARLRPDDEVLWGVDADPAADALAGSLAILGRQAHDRALVVRCSPGTLINRKVDKLVQMTPHARGDRWVMLDSEALPSAALLREVRRTLAPAAAVTAAYRFVGGVRWTEMADAAITSGFLFSGYAWARVAGARPTAFGACLGLTRQMWSTFGGWERFGNQLADDYEIGRALHEAGYRLIVCREPVTLRADPLDWGGFWEHQRRVALTYRVSQPAGFAGAGVVLTLPLIVTAFRRGGVAAGFATVAMAWVWRSLALIRLGQALGAEEDRARLWLLTPLAVATEAAAWLSAWTSNRLRWGQRALRVRRDGTLRPATARE